MHRLLVFLLMIFYSETLSLIEAGRIAGTHIERASRKSSRRGKDNVMPAEGNLDERLQQYQPTDKRNLPLVIKPPRRKQVNPRELMTVLGADFNSEWMSIDKPSSLVVEPRTDTLPPPHNKVWNDMKKLNLTHTLRTPQTKEALPEESISSIEHWLLGRASCGVRYVWENIGPFFWPRWIRRGECVNTAERPCSWPPGMHCVPAESMTLHVLRWHCRPSSGASKRNGFITASAIQRTNPGSVAQETKCQWFRVPYPVTSECFCSC